MYVSGACERWRCDCGVRGEGVVVRVVGGTVIDDSGGGECMLHYI